MIIVTVIFIMLLLRGEGLLPTGTLYHLLTVFGDFGGSNDWDGLNGGWWEMVAMMDGGWGKGANG